MHLVLYCSTYRHTIPCLPRSPDSQNLSLLRALGKPSLPIPISHPPGCRTRVTSRRVDAIRDTIKPAYDLTDYED